MENRHKTMLEDHFEHGFAVEWMRKDLAIVLEEARRNGSSLPVTALVDQFYAEVEKISARGGDNVEPVRAGWKFESLLAQHRANQFNSRGRNKRSTAIPLV